jgi:hypothetical protein
MNQHNSEEKRDPEDPERKEMQPPIPTHPADPQLAGDADKVVASKKSARDPSHPSLVSTGVGSGPVIDEVGGAGLGLPPGDAGKQPQTPATTRDQDTRAVDQQDRTQKS